jgi:hypothetical protein
MNDRSYLSVLIGCYAMECSILQGLLPICRSWGTSKGTKVIKERKKWGTGEDTEGKVFLLNFNDILKKCSKL